ncbi:MAG: hypothetical protein JW779_04905 [Candidatus Thorarchaeota archaeon]|nr:hypothetical protein [Candidatus Thorarchaeota archaeon]
MVIYMASYKRLESQLEDVKQVLEEIDQLRRSEINHIRKQIVNKTTDEAKHVWGDRDFFFDKSLPKVNNNTYLIAIMAYFEDFIVYACNRFATRHGLQRFDAFGFESVASKLRKFIKLTKLSLSLSQPDWNTIILYWKIRNCVVHAGSKYSLLKDEEKKFIDRSPHFCVEMITSVDDSNVTTSKPTEFYISDHKCLDDLVWVVLKFSKRFTEAITKHDKQLKPSIINSSTTKTIILKTIAQIIDLLVRKLRKIRPEI